MRLQNTERVNRYGDSVGLRLLCFCLFVALGGVVGYLLQKTVSGESNAELCQYLQQYADSCAKGTDTPVSFLRVLAVYYRYPLLAFCLGFCTIGIYLLPVLCMVQGFFLSFSICCFASAMGREGVYLAFSAFGLRVLLTLPCLLLLTLQAFDHAKELRGSVRKRDRHSRNRLNKAYLALPGICAAVLLAGAMLEITLLPHLFQWVAERFA